MTLLLRRTGRFQESAEPDVSRGLWPQRQTISEEHQPHIPLGEANIKFLKLRQMHGLDDTISAKSRKTIVVLSMSLERI
jgi:hypothetical protein